MSDARYNTTRWRRIRARQLAKEPLCAFCQMRGIAAVANTVDHIVPHRGDAARFWSTTNLQSLCAPCHSSTKQAAENIGPGATGLDGWPAQDE